MLYRYETMYYGHIIWREGVSMSDDGDCRLCTITWGGYIKR